MYSALSWSPFCVFFSLDAGFYCKLNNISVAISRGKQSFGKVLIISHTTTLFFWVLIRNGCEFFFVVLHNQFVGSSRPRSCRCLNKNSLRRRCSKPPRPQMENKPTKAELLFVIKGPWEMDERRMEGDRGLRGPSDSWGCLRGNPRNGRWDRLSKQGGFRHNRWQLCPRAIYVISAPLRSCIERSSYQMREQ